MATADTLTRDVTLTSRDGLTLQARYWAQNDPRGVLVVAHGFGEHGGCYAHVAQAIGPSLGLDVLAPDLRGHGRSPGRRGVVGAFGDFTADLTAALQWASRQRPGLPLFLLGHSNGGQVALHAALDPVVGPGLAGLILSNPSLRLAARVPRHKILVARLLHWFAPGLTLAAPIEVEKLSRDPAMHTYYRGDALRHDRISAPLFFGMVEGGEALLGRVQGLTLPVLMIVSGSDPIIDPAACRLAFDRIASPDKTLLLFPQMLHEPLNELGRQGVLSDLANWLDARLPARP